METGYLRGRALLWAQRRCPRLPGGRGGFQNCLGISQRRLWRDYEVVWFRFKIALSFFFVLSCSWVPYWNRWPSGSQQLQSCSFRKISTCSSWFLILSTCQVKFSKRKSPVTGNKAIDWTTARSWCYFCDFLSWHSKWSLETMVVQNWSSIRKH